MALYGIWFREMMHRVTFMSFEAWLRKRQGLYPVPLRKDMVKRCLN